ncbi:MAG: T9SS type A sorting domain-containing protein [Ferruginibacter sp.]
MSTYYLWSQSSGTYTPGLSTTSTTPANIFSTLWDDVAYTGYTLPFTFNYNGTNYTNIGLDADGWITFSNGVPTMTGQAGGGSWVSISDQTGVYLYGTANNNGFAAFNCDINDQAFATFTGTRTNGSPTITGASSTANLQIGTRLVGTGITDGTVVTNIVGSTVTMSSNSTANSSSAITPRASIYAFTRGTAPNRQFVIQWTQAKRFSGTGAENINFQLILNEGNGSPALQTLQSVYGACTTTNTSVLNVQVGLRGASTADFNARSGNTWGSTTAAVANTDKVLFSNTINPASGLTFTWSPCTTAPGVPGAISGTSSLCANTSATYSIAAVTGATFYTWTYSGTGASFTSPTTSPSLAVTFAPGATSGTLSVTAGNLCGTNATASTLPITVNALPTATISYPAAGYCTNTSGTISVTRSGTAGGTYSASPSGLSINNSTGTITPSSSSVGSYTVTYSFTNGTCPNTTTTTVTINPIPAVTATATPSVMCSGGNSQLLVTPASTGYMVNSIGYSSLNPAGTATNIYNVYTDEAISGAIALPFTFTYYGQAITQFYACTNGYIQLQSGPVNSATPQTLPGATTPNNVIALAWDDLVVDPVTLPGSNIRYFVNGVSPNRVVVIDFVKLSVYGFFSNVGNITGQIRLYEDNHIEIAAGTVNDAGELDSKTLGIENNTGTLGLTPTGRNNAVWNVTNEAWGFYPANYSYLWSPATFLSSTTIANPVASGVTGTTNYSALVTNTFSGCSASVPATVTISAPLNGVYTVGPGGNYTTLTEAVNAYNNICISGPVTFSLINNLYSASETFPIIINSNAYASSVNTLTIKPAIGVSPTISGNSAIGILKLNAADYVTIDGSNAVGGTTRDLTITNTSTNATTSTIIWLNSISGNGATNNTVKNCVLPGNASTTTFVSLMSSGSSVGGIAEFANSNNKYTNNQFIKAQTAIAIVGPTGNETGNIINGNIIGSATFANKLSWSGIEIYQQANCKVDGNKIFGIVSANSTIASGISVYGTASNDTISGNSISDIKNTSTLGYGCNGIYLAATTTASNITVMNNFIFDIAGYGYNGFTSFDNGYGLVLDYGGGYKIYHNTVVLNTNQTFAGAQRSAAILVYSDITTANSIDLRNNIFGNTQTNGNSNSTYAMLCTAPNSVFSNINYNDYYSPKNNILLCRGSNGTQFQTIAAVQGNIGGNLNSVTINPTYTSATDYHLQSIAGNSTISNIGTPISGITIDYDTTTRNGLTPDIGADEWLMPNTGSWVGKTSIDWLTNTNWETNKVPDATTDVTITGGYTYMPTIGTGLTQPVRALLLSAPVPANTPILTLSGGTIQIYGTITRTGGSISGSNGTVEMNGTAAQTIPASLFVSNNLKNLVIGNNTAAGVTIGGTLDIYRSLTFSGSGLKLTTGNFLTFKSTATETAWLGNMTGKTIVGNATVERYIPTGINHGKSWQLLAVPVSGTQSVKASWQEGQNPGVVGISNYGTTISSEKTGATGRGFDFYTAPGPSIKTYDPATATYIGIDDGVTNTSALQIANQKGYMLLVRGDRSVQTSAAAATPTTLRTYGKLFTATAGELPPVTTVLAGKFATIGNPYASAIDFTAVTRAAGVDNVFYIWDPLLPGSNTLGGYQTISSVTGYKPTPGSVNYPSNTAITKIQSGQAFYVHGTAGGNVSFTEAAKISGSQLVQRSTSVASSFVQPQILRANLYKMSSASLGPVDGNVVAFDPTFSNDFESQDALKLINTGENFGILSNDKILAVEAKEPIVNIDTIFYNLANLRHEAYQFRFAPDNLNAVNQQAFLVDRFLNTQTPVSLLDTTVIDFDITNDAASSAVDRFYLVFKQLVIVPVTITHIAATRINDTKIAVTWKVDNEINIDRFELERSGDGRNFNKLHAALPKLNNGGAADYLYNDEHPLNADNFYRIKAVSRSGQVQYSAIVKVAAVKVDASITIYPNPVVDKIMNVEFINQEKGIYQLDLIDVLGQTVYSNSITVNGNNLVESIQLGKSIAAGNYQLKMIVPGKKAIIKQVLIQ